MGSYHGNMLIYYWRKRSGEERSGVTHTAIFGKLHTTVVVVVVVVVEFFLRPFSFFFYDVVTTLLLSFTAML